MLSFPWLHLENVFFSWSHDEKTRFKSDTRLLNETMKNKLSIVYKNILKIIENFNNESFY